MPTSESTGAVREDGLPLFLSPKQKLALTLAAQGLTDRAIARKLDRSIWTVRMHLQAARSRLGAANTTNAVAIAVARQLIQFDTVTVSS